MDSNTITSADSPAVASEQQRKHHESDKQDQNNSPDEDVQTKYPNWYSNDDALTVKTLSPAVKALFTEYVGLKEEDVVPHILSVRRKAWKIFPYPCIGNFRFLDISILAHPFHDDIIARLKSSFLNPSHSSLAATSTFQKFLDLGCCFAQDIRLLIHAGVNPSQLYAADLQKDFLLLGLELFKDDDRARFVFEDEKEGNVVSASRDTDASGDDDHAKATYLNGDIFNPSHLKSLENSMDVIHIGSFLHLWDLAKQKKACKRIIGFLTKEESPVMTTTTTTTTTTSAKVKVNNLIIGRQVGSTKAGEYPTKRDPNSSMFRHDPASFQKMWEEVGEEMGAGNKWQVETKLINWGVLENRMVKETMKQESSKGSMVDGVEMSGLQFTVRCVE